MMMPNMGMGGQGMAHPGMQGMQGGGNPSGIGGGRGFGGRGRGGRGGAPKADTIKVQITQVHHPVTENLIRQVFGTVENISPPLDIHVRPYMPGEEPVVAVVRFANPTDADVALKARNNCDIYTGCLHMTISFTRFEREVNGGGQHQQPHHQQQMGMMGMQQQAAPIPQQGAPQQMSMQGHHHHQQQHQQQQQQAPQQMGMMGMQQFHHQMQVGGHHQQQQSRQMMPGTMGQPQYPNQQQQFGQMSAPPQQAPQPQYIPQQQMGGGMHPMHHHQHSMSHMMGYPMMPYGGHQMQQYPQGMAPNQQYPPLYGYPGMMPQMMDGNMGGGRGGRGRGRGRGAMNGMPGAMGGMPGFPGMPMNFNPVAQVGPGGRGGATPGGYTKPTAHEMETCPFLSIAMFPKTEPLIKLFHLLECWGGVVSLRRNQKNNDIIVAKMQSPADAQAICKHLNKVPVCGVDCSGRLFSTYTERNTPSNEGDATNVEVTQYDFTNFRHRQPALRCDFNASHELMLSGCAQKSESEVMNFFSERDIFPEALHKIEEEGTFRIRMDSVAAAVSLLTSCQWQVCDSEKSNLTFCEEIINRSPANEGVDDNTNNYQNQNDGHQQLNNNVSADTE